jgi:hypothetical protein
MFLKIRTSDSFFAMSKTGSVETSGAVLGAQRRQIRCPCHFKSLSQRFMKKKELFLLTVADRNFSFSI